MSLIDDPKGWILRLFELEEREGRGSNCQRFPSGVQPAGVPLEGGEQIYGIYKDKYLFTSQSLITRTQDGFTRIRWDTIAHCTTKHGEGKKKAELTLTDGSTHTVQVGDFATGWSGRISQLFHQLIEKLGAATTYGHPPLSIEDFFAAAKDEFCLAPNLEPHPTLEQMRNALLRLRAQPGIENVLLGVLEIEDDGPVSDTVIIRSHIPDIDVSEFVREFHAEGPLEAPDDVARLFPALHTRLIVWD